jgi:hypothetical protein
MRTDLGILLHRRCLRKFPFDNQGSIQVFTPIRISQYVKDCQTRRDILVEELHREMLKSFG